MRTKSRKFLSLLLSVAVLCALTAVITAPAYAAAPTLSPVTAFAASGSQDGLTATVTADKASYGAGDTANVTVSVTNNNTYGVNNVSLNLTLPAGLALKTGQTQVAVGTLNAGQTQTYTLTASAKSATPAPASSAVTASGANPQTGDGFPVTAWLALMILSIGVLITLGLRKTKDKRGVKMLSLFLCVALVLTVAAPTLPVFAATEHRSLSVNQPVTVNGSNEYVTLTVSYDYLLDAINQTPLVIQEGNQIKTYGDTPFTLTATGGSTGNPVTWTSSDPTVATVTATDGTHATVTILKATTAPITITATMPGSTGNIGDAPDYLMASAATMITVAKKTVTALTDVTADNKEYDGTTDATLGTTATSPDLVNGDTTLTITGGTGTFADKNAGPGISVSYVDGIALAGTSADNYTLDASFTVNGGSDMTADITLRPVTSITGLTATKTYDGATTGTATINSTSAALTGNLDGTNLTVTATTAVYDTKDAGTGIPVTFSGLTLGGSAAGNYLVDGTTSCVGIGTINPKPLTVTQTGGQASPIGCVAVTVTGGYVSGESVSDLSYNSLSGSMSGIACTYDTLSGSMLVFNAVTTTVDNTSLSGTFTADLGNYTVSFDITSASLGTTDTNPIQVSQLNMTDFDSYAGSSDGLSKNYSQVEDITLAAPASGSSNWTAIGGNTTSTAFAGSYDGGGHTITDITIQATTNSVGMFGTITTGTVKNLRLENISVTGQSYVGGLVAHAGWNGNCTIQNCSVSGNVSSGDGDAYVGGIAGEIDSGMIQNCYAAGNVTCTTYVGGIVGGNAGTIQNCYTAGSVTGQSFVGGIVGRNIGTIQNCYTAGSVTGTSGVGGIVGEMYAGSVQNCMALNPDPGVMTASADSSSLGRIAGGNYGGNFAGNYALSSMDIEYNWDGTTGTPKTVSDGLDTVDGLGVDLATTQSQDWWDGTTFGIWTTPWDFTSIWIWDNTLQRPVLQWQQ